MPTIPSSYQASDTLPDGQQVYFRAIRPDDRDGLLQAFHQLSSATVRDRFFNVKLDLSDAELEHFTNVDFRRHVALVAELEIDQQRRPIAVGRFIGVDDLPGHAEMAITVMDQYQGMGIGTVMLNQLIRCAREVEFHHLDASVFAANTRMIRMLRRTGLPVTRITRGEISDLSITL